MLKVLSVFGTRPEAIKMAPVVKQLEKMPDRIESSVCVTAQHRGMLDQVLAQFDIKPSYDLNIMRAGQGLSEVAAHVLNGMEPILRSHKPDWVLVQGDTTTVLAAALAAFHNHVRVGHVEAGLRTHDRSQPFPEEMNRRVASILADLHFAPTSGSRANLLREGIDDGAIHVTGNPVIDAVRMLSGVSYDHSSGPLHAIPWDARIILVTAHRRESFGPPIEQICGALRDIVKSLGDIHVVYPVHPNPNIREVVHGLLGDTERISLIEPLDYLPFIHLLRKSTLVLTDSGGIQEEAPSLGKPVLVLRDVTERPEAVTAGTVRLVGTDRKAIVEAALTLLSNPAEYDRMAKAINPYGDGFAAERIVNALVSQRS